MSRPATKEKQPDTRELIIDAQIVCDRYNEAAKAYNAVNPELKQKEMLDLKALTKKVKVNDTLFRVWKNERTPQWLEWLFDLMEIGDCDLRDFVIDKRPAKEAE